MPNTYDVISFMGYMKLHPISITSHSQHMLNRCQHGDDTVGVVTRPTPLGGIKKNENFKDLSHIF